MSAAEITLTINGAVRQLSVARLADADLLVLAERTGAATLLGGVSQYVLRKAPCPVLPVPETGPGTPSS